MNDKLPQRPITYCNLPDIPYEYQPPSQIDEPEALICIAMFLNREQAIADRLEEWLDTYSGDEVLWNSNDCDTDIRLFIKELRGAK